MKRVYDITILSHSSSWMVKYDFDLQKKLESLGHKVSVVTSIADIGNGDIAFFLSCFDIVGKSVLNKHRNNIVVHASDLPQGRGWSPTTWQILEGKNNIPLTLFEAVEAVDAGDIYLQDVISLNGFELISEWQQLLGEKIVELCVNFVKQYPEVTHNAKQQRDEGSFYRRRTPADSELDINKSLKEQFNLLRVVDNEQYPAFFEIDGHRYKLKIERYE